MDDIYSAYKTARSGKFQDYAKKTAVLRVVYIAAWPQSNQLFQVFFGDWFILLQKTVFSNKPFYL